MAMKIYVRAQLAALAALAALALALALAISEPAFAQLSFPTAASGVRVAGTVPLQCDASAANCAPPSSTNPLPTGGTIASGATDSGNPVKVGGRYNLTAPTLADGQRGDLQLDTRANLIVTINGKGGTGGATVVAAADALAGQSGMAVQGQTAVYNGTTWDRARGDANGLVVQPGLTSTYWQYTSGVTPILSNTATGVTIKAAAGASVRNYIDSCQLTTTAFGASVPLALRDGTGGTVRWALTVPTAGFLQPVTINFSPALQGTANTLWEVATPTANTTGTVTMNCQGHTGI